MTDPQRTTYSEWPLFRADDIDEWYQEYERTIELFTELSNLHAGLRCEGLRGQWCSACDKVTGDGLTNFRLITFINSYDQPESR